MRFVPIKDIVQQDIQALHRVRERLVRDRTAVVNQTRGLLREYGVFLPEGIRPFRRQIPEVLEDAQNELTPLAREITADQYARLHELDQRIDQYSERINAVFRGSDMCQRLVAIDGVGPITATALIAAAGNAQEFQNGRHFAAWLGLVPRQHSSGQSNKLLGISKRGNTYLRIVIGGVCLSRHTLFVMWWCNSSSSLAAATMTMPAKRPIDDVLLVDRFWHNCLSLFSKKRRFPAAARPSYRKTQEGYINAIWASALDSSAGRIDDYLNVKGRLAGLPV